MAHGAWCMEENFPGLSLGLVKQGQVGYNIEWPKKGK